MALTKAVILGGIGAIAVPFVLSGSTAPAASLMAGMAFRGPSGMVLNWSWPIFCLVTGVAWALFRLSRN